MLPVGWSRHGSCYCVAVCWGLMHGRCWWIPQSIIVISNNENHFYISKWNILSQDVPWFMNKRKLTRCTIRINIFHKWINIYHKTNTYFTAFILTIQFISSMFINLKLYPKRTQWSTVQVWSWLCVELRIAARTERFSSALTLMTSQANSRVEMVNDLSEALRWIMTTRWQFYWPSWYNSNPTFLSKEFYIYHYCIGIPLVGKHSSSGFVCFQETELWSDGQCTHNITHTYFTKSIQCVLKYK